MLKAQFIYPSLYAEAVKHSQGFRCNNNINIDLHAIRICLRNTFICDSSQTYSCRSDID